MDSVEMLVQSVQDLATAKYLMTSAIALTLYDYLLTLDDEIRYVWRGRKTWTFYLYILNRILLIGYQFWGIYYTTSQTNSKAGCFARYYVQVSLVIFFLFSSDVFIALRVYAITFKNKIIGVYFGALTLARLATSLALPFVRPPTFVDLSQLPIGTFSLCGIIADLQYTLIPSSIGTLLGLSAFLVIVWYTYRNKNALRFSALVRTIAAEATVYLLVTVAAQVYIQLSLSLTEGVRKELSFLAYGLLNPILTMRFAVSLKRSADPDGGQERQLTHFSSVGFAGGHSPGTQASPVRDNIEMDPVDPSNEQIRARGPRKEQQYGWPLLTTQ